MNRPGKHEGRPLAETTLEEIAGGDVSILDAQTRVHPKAIAPAYAVLVQRRNGQWTRQLYLSLHSATRAMERAEERGVEARCQLVEIVPVPALPVVVVGGGESQ